MTGSEKSKLFWVSNRRPRGLTETRVLELLRASNIRVLAYSFDQADEVRPEPGDLVVLNGGEEEVRRWLETSDPGNPVVFVLRGASARAELIPAGFQGAVHLLDPQEGPEITKARILSIMGRNGGTPGPSSPECPSAQTWRRNLIGDSPSMQRVCEVVRLVGPRRCTVLITGETGTGKEVVARTIHAAGPRETKPFVAINCSALPANLLEAELFGHTKGAFTGAVQNRTGRFEQAHGGTLFLDEIGELPLELQAKLLRVLQEREFQRLGSSETVRVEARVIAATNCDLSARVREGSFREDLFYRLNVVPLQLPPLRMRVSDIRPLVLHFLDKICKEEQIEPKRVTPRGWTVLEQFKWPGNVRQLENAISSAVILSEHRPYLDAEDFPMEDGVSRVAADDPVPMSLPDEGLDFERTVAAMERNLLTQALRRTGGNKKAAAEMLGLKRTTLSAKVRVLEIHEGAA